MTIPNLIDELAARGLTLDVRDGHLRCGPARLLTDDLLKALRRHRTTLYRMLWLDPLPRDQWAQAPEDAFVEASEEDFCAQWGAEAGALCWGFWMTWGESLVRCGVLGIDEALDLRYRITAGRTGAHAETLLQHLQCLQCLQRLYEVANGAVSFRHGSSVGPGGTRA